MTFSTGIRISAGLAFALILASGAPAFGKGTTQGSDRNIQLRQAIQKRGSTLIEVSRSIDLARKDGESLKERMAAEENPRKIKNAIKKNEKSIQSLRKEWSQLGDEMVILQNLLDNQITDTKLLKARRKNRSASALEKKLIREILRMRVDPIAAVEPVPESSPELGRALSASRSQ